MEILSVCPLRAAPFVWEPRPDTWVLTVVVKATYTLRAGEALLAAEQEPLYAEDQHWNGDPSHSVRAPADLLPVKPNAEVMLSGHAYAEGGRPVRSFVARIAVGSVDKKIEIHADRTLSADNVVHEGAPITTFPIVYERTAGGAGTDNPVGMADTRDASGARVLPNIVAMPSRASATEGSFEPSCFGPIAADWPSRKKRLGSHPDLANGSLAFQVLPPDVDIAFFSQGPLDQQLPALHEDEWIALSHLHPSEPQLVTRLPGVRPVVFVERPGKAPQKLSMRADTLWIDSDRAIATLTFRAPIALESPNEAGRILVAMDPPGLESKWEDIEKIAQQRGVRRTPGSSPTPVPDSGRHETSIWQAGTAAPVEVPSASPLKQASELFELLAWDPAVVPRIRRIAGYTPLLSALLKRPRDIDLDEPHEALGLPHVAERREVFEILVSGEPLTPRSMVAMFEGGIREDGKYVAPLALVAGEFVPLFDPGETLKATISIVGSLLEEEDTTLRAALEKANKRLPVAPVVAEETMREIRDALDKKNKETRARFEERLTKTLVPSRAYERVVVFGESFMRANLFVPEQPTPLVVYVPEAFEKKLPLFARFGVRMLCDVALRVDERETEPFALRVLAIARGVLRERMGAA